MMKLHKMDPIWISITVLALAILACIGNTPVVAVDTQTPPPPPTSVSQNPTPGSQNPGSTQVPPPLATPPPNLPAMIKATVEIYGLFMENGKLTPKAQGSGTLISSTGMILTNARIASPASQGAPDLEPDALAIGLIDQVDQPPVPLYLAKVKAVDGYMDLAVLQITSTLDGTDVDPNSLNLPFVPLGNSDDLFVGQHINIFGYPVYDSRTISYTDGLVASFLPEEGLGDRAWIKTDVAISSGNSGGLAADDAGAIIGIPAFLTGVPPDCRRLTDTNGDGVIDDKDSCLGSDFETGLRPVNLALPLITAVQTGQTYVSPFPVPTPAPTQNSPTPTPGG